MITFEIKVNGELIGYVQAVNKGSIILEGGKYSSFDKYVLTVCDITEKQIIVFEISHNPKEGYERLVVIAFTEILKRKEYRR